VQTGLSVKLLETDDLAAGDLQQYDCIIAGVRAYDVRRPHCEQCPPAHYVKQGGVLCPIQSKEPWNKAQYAPIQPR
jgi:hypothetical protein